jgi:NAD(P)H-dependent FMN reductase
MHRGLIQHAEWQNKAAAFAAYGSLSGARAVEHLRLICSELQMATVRQQLSFSLFTDFANFTTFTPAPLHNDSAPSCSINLKVGQVL